MRDLNEQMDEISKNITEQEAYNEEVESRNKEEIANYSRNLRFGFEKQLQEQNKVIKQMHMQLTQLQAQVTELKKPKQTRPRPNQIQWKQNDWRSSSYQNQHQVYYDDRDY